MRVEQFMANMKSRKPVFVRAIDGSGELCIKQWDKIEEHPFIMNQQVIDYLFNPVGDYYTIFIDI